jgi:FixJ family two-component response regulator
VNLKTIIHVIDDDVSFRTALARLLHAHGYDAITYASAEEYLPNPSTDRGCLILDVRMPKISGLQTQTELTARHDPLPIIFVTGHGDIPMSVRAIKAGAEDFLSKPIPSKRLFVAIESALARYDKMRTQRTLHLYTKIKFERLTPRETEVFWHVVAGKLNRVIAEELGTAERTIKAHRHQITEKLEVSSVAELVKIAQLLKTNT